MIKCGDCGWVDKTTYGVDKCSNCKSDDWVEVVEETPRSIAIKIVRKWFDDSSFEQITIADERRLVGMISKAIKKERL